MGLQKELFRAVIMRLSGRTKMNYKRQNELQKKRNLIISFIILIFHLYIHKLIFFKKQFQVL